MNVVKIAVETMGADYRQWRSLTRALYKSRRHGAISSAAKTPRSRLGSVGPSPLVYGAMGILFVGLALRVPMISDASTLALSIVMLIVFVSLLTEYGVSLAYDDLNMLRCFPVANRTFFVCRLTNLLRWTGSVVVFIATPTLILTLFREGLLSAIGWVVALALSSAFVAFCMATLFATAFRLMASNARRRWIAQACLVVGVIVFCAALAGPAFAVESDGVRTGASQPWSAVLVFPPMWPPNWFSAFVDVANGAHAPQLVLCAAMALVCTLAAFFAMRRSWAYAYELIRDDRSVRSPAERIPNWLPAEARICATLTWGHFRCDASFRLRVLAGLPLGLALLALSLLHYLEVEAVAAWLDPFMALGLIHIAAVFVPLSWLGALHHSDAFRAAWIFAATPVDTGKVLFWSGVCVGAFFALPYLALVGGTLFLLLGACAAETMRQ